MKDSEKKANVLWWRKKYLEAMIISLRIFKETKDVEFKEIALYFGELSNEYRKY